MRLLLCAVLILGGCAGKSTPELTPDNVKRGAPRLYVGCPPSLRFNTRAMFRIMIKGSDRQFPKGEYAIVATLNQEPTYFFVYPSRRRYYEITAGAPGAFPMTAGRAHFSASLHEVHGFAWNGAASLGPPLLREECLVEMKGTEAGP